MAESKFLKWQDKDGDGLVDECNDLISVPEVNNCPPKCYPNPYATVPDWTKQELKEPYLDEKYCIYHVVIETPFTSLLATTEDADAPTTSRRLTQLVDVDPADAEQKSQRIIDIYAEYENVATLCFLAGLGKAETEESISAILDGLVSTDFDLNPRPNSRVKLQYSIDYKIIELLEDGPMVSDTTDSEASDSGEAAEGALGTEVTYQADEFFPKLLKVRKGLNLYNRYLKVFRAIDGGNIFFKKPPQSIFNLQDYGDNGISNDSVLAEAFEEIDAFLNKNGYNIVGVGPISFSNEKVTEITLIFDKNYKLESLKILTQACGSEPKVWSSASIENLRNSEPFKDKTAMAYLLNLDAMETDLTAREPKPWLEFIKEHTFPEVQETFDHSANRENVEQNANNCIAAALEKEAKQLGQDILDDVFGIGDAIAYQFHKNLCKKSAEELRKEDAKLGLVIDPTAPKDEAKKNIMLMAKEQAYKELEENDQVFAQFCSRLIMGKASGKKKKSTGLSKAKPPSWYLKALWKEGFDRTGVCGLQAVTWEVISCLLGNLSLEDGLSAIVKSALTSMSLENFGELFAGIPADKQAQIQEIAKNNLKAGNIFRNNSRLQVLSDELDLQSEAQGEMSVLWEDEEEIKKDKKNSKKTPFGERPSRSAAASGEGMEGPEKEKRTLAQQFDISNTAPGKGTGNPAIVIQAYTDAIITVYSDDLLSVVDFLNKFPGAELIARILVAMDCPRPPILNPSIMDFIKDIELPFCRSINVPVLPKLQNPGVWIPKFKDLAKAIFEALKLAIQQALLNIIIKLLVKICELIGGSLCDALKIGAKAAASLVMNDKTELYSIIGESVCGEGASDQQIGDTLVALFDSLGLGGAALADREQALNFASDVSSSTTRSELMNALGGKPSADFMKIVDTLIKYEYPQYRSALPNKRSVGNFFGNIGNLFPAEIRDQMKDFTDSLPDDDELPANPTLCATPEDLENYKQLRCDLLSGRAAPEQCDVMFNREQERIKNDLGDLTDLMQGGFPLDTMPPILSNPGCNNGMVPYESDEAIAATGVALNSSMEQLKIDFSEDMLGSGGIFGSWGLLNMILSDTLGKPYTTHLRQVRLSPAYVDFYQPDPGLDVVDRLAISRGAYPYKIAEWLQKQYLGEDEVLDLTESIVFDSNNLYRNDKRYINNFSENDPPDGLEGTDKNFKLISMPDMGYNVDITSKAYFDGSQFTIQLMMISNGRKHKPDLTLKFRDNAKGFRSGPDSRTTAPSYGFDLEMYLSDLETTLAPENNVAFSSYSDYGPTRDTGEAPASAAKGQATYGLTDWKAYQRSLEIMRGSGLGQGYTGDPLPEQVDDTMTQEAEEPEEYGSVDEEATSDEELNLYINISVPWTSAQESDYSQVLPCRNAVVFGSYDTTRIKLIEKFNPAAKSPNPLFKLVYSPFDVLDGDGDDLSVESRKFEFLCIDDGLKDVDLTPYPEWLGSFQDDPEGARNATQHMPQVVLLREMLNIADNNENNFQDADIKQIYDSLMEYMSQTISSEIGNNTTAFLYGAQFDSLTREDLDYLVPPGYDNEGEMYSKGKIYDEEVEGDRFIEEDDGILGVSRMQYEIENEGRDEENRVFYLPPDKFGGKFTNPAFHITPLKNEGWLGFVDVLFPELAPCKPRRTDLVDFDQIQQKVDEKYPTIPEDARIKSDPDCVKELPYHRILERISTAGLESVIMSAIRIYVSAHMIKNLAVFTKFKPSFPGVFSTIYAHYIVEDMRESFKDAQGDGWELFNTFKDEEFWYAFLEQSVQLYDRRLKSGEIQEPPESVVEALLSINDMQEFYQYPSKEDLEMEKEVGSVKGIKTLKNYRNDKNLEAIFNTQEAAKLVLKEMIVEELNYMGEKLFKNLQDTEMSPDIRDISYYFLENFTQGASLSLRGDIEEEIDETLPIEGQGYYTSGGEFSVFMVKDPESPFSEGDEYVGEYHVHMDENGDLLYMADANHSSKPHDLLKPFALKVTVPIGDVADYGYLWSDSDTMPFLVEKYIKLDDTRYAPTDAISLIKENDNSLNISDVYPGTLEEIYAESTVEAEFHLMAGRGQDSDTIKHAEHGQPAPDAPNILSQQFISSESKVIGITGELGARHGLLFSMIVNGTKVEIASAEIDMLDVEISKAALLEGNSKLLFCLINKLKDDEKFRTLVNYIFPLNKLTSTFAIYNDMAFLESIGEVTAAADSVATTLSPSSTPIEDKPGMRALPPDSDTGAPTVEGTEGWASIMDRNLIPSPLGRGPFLDYDDWNRSLLKKTTSRIKKLFKSHYHYRDFEPGKALEGDGPGAIWLKNLRDRFRPEAGLQVVPRWQRKNLRSTPFDLNGELCEKE